MRRTWARWRSLCQQRHSPGRPSCTRAARTGDARRPHHELGLRHQDEHRRVVQGAPRGWAGGAEARGCGGGGGGSRGWAGGGSGRGRCARERIAERGVARRRCSAGWRTPTPTPRTSLARAAPRAALPPRPHAAAAASSRLLCCRAAAGKINEDYRVNWIVDNLPAATRVVRAPRPLFAPLAPSCGVAHAAGPEAGPLHPSSPRGEVEGR